MILLFILVIYFIYTITISTGEINRVELRHSQEKQIMCQKG